MQTAQMLTSAVSGVAQVGGEAVRLVVPLPLGAAAVVVVGEDLVVVDVAAGQQGAPARAAHRRRHVGVSQLRALVPDAPQGVRHKVQRTCGIQRGGCVSRGEQRWLAGARVRRNPDAAAAG